MNDSVPVRNAQRRLASEQRLRSAHDLMCRIPTRAPRSIADVFSGQGSMRPLLAQRFPAAGIEAFDLSQSGERMAERRPEWFASQGSGDRVPARRKFDLICLNGSLELLPSLPRLLPVFVGMLAAGGWLAVQIPNDLYEPSRALVRMIGRRAVGEETAADRQDAAVQRNDGRTLRAPQPDLSHRRHLGGDLPPCH